ncbi:4-amino-4-deoxychorismate lyase [Kocuria varians]|uniref:4-amino-4-deoxychorismate lyase n=1 Tax=Kocuria varians TaxID=1272 RepID=A0A4Y4DAC5_KOCVA|nr:aminotransferase class IV [Kocuria varians]GED00238.1 4-amino-4-deoxychorismate lyase [Kocuria varians]
MTPTASSAVVLSPVTGTPRLVDPLAPHVGLEDQGLTRGDGVFETLHVLDGDPYKFDAHHARLCASARTSGLPAPSAQLCREALALGLDAAPPGSRDPFRDLGAEHSVKLSVSRGVPGGQPWAWLTVAPVPEQTFAARRGGVSVLLLERGHDPAEDSDLPWLLPGVKTLSYAVNMAAVRHARSHGAQDAIFTTSTDHRILEGATSSVVCARTAADAPPTLLTPEPSRGILPGTSQARIFDAARRHGWAVDYGPLYPQDLLTASAVWLTSSVRLAVPVTAVDGRPVPTDPALTRSLTDFLLGRDSA